MPAVLQLTRKLIERPMPADVPGVYLRNYQGPDDADHWLELRSRAFARQKLGVRHWDRDDFQRDLLAKNWWRPENMWLAVTRSSLSANSVVGSVVLARRDGQTPKPVVHWLIVDPSFRRRGIGRLLMSTLERAVWESGGRQVWLETHALWREAARLYESLGYRPDDRDCE